MIVWSVWPANLESLQEPEVHPYVQERCNPDTPHELLAVCNTMPDLQVDVGGFRAIIKYIGVNNLSLPPATRQSAA